MRNVEGSQLGPHGAKWAWSCEMLSSKLCLMGWFATVTMDLPNMDEMRFQRQIPLLRLM
jgi:hypothetical protein